MRDVEASLQEAVLDQIDQLILFKVTAVATAEAAGRAMEALGSLLGALTEPGTSAQVSLGQAMASLAAKRRLKGDKAARGLQNIICAAGGCSLDLALLSGGGGADRVAEHRLCSRCVLLMLAYSKIVRGMQQAYHRAGESFLSLVMKAFP